MEPRSTDTRLIQTSVYKFCLSRRKAHIFSLKLPRLIRTRVDKDIGHFSVSRVNYKLSYIVNPSLRTLFIWALSIAISVYNCETPVNN